MNAISKPLILVVDDEPDLCELVQFALERAGYTVLTAGDGVTAVKLAEAEAPDLILLDVMMPGMDGHQVCYRLKSNEETRRIPIMMVTARSEETDEIIGLGIGADDYITKPFSPRVLTARVAALLRRSETAEAELDEGDTIRRGVVTLRLNRHEVTLDGETIHLTPIEFKILAFLAKRPGWVYTRERIIGEVLGDDVVITERTVDVHVVALRKKLGVHADIIQTVRGIGYKYRD